MVEVYFGTSDFWMPFESNILKNIIKNGQYTTDVFEVDGDTYYKIYNDEIDRLVEDLKKEKEVQWQQGLFLKRKTITYKDITSLLEILTMKRRYDFIGQKVEVFKILEIEDLIGDLAADMEGIIEELEKEEEVAKRRKSIAVVHPSPTKKE